jgi:bacillolysin
VGLEELHYHTADEDAEPFGIARERELRGALPEDLGDTVTSFNSDEEAARYYLNAVLQGDDRGAMRSVAASEDPSNVPGLDLVDSRDSPATGTVLVRFVQSREEIPVFGTRAVVELTPDRELVAVGARFGDPDEVSTTPSLDPAEAISRVSAHTQTELDPESLPAPTLRFFYDEAQDSWHLAWLLRDVPAVPPALAAKDDEPESTHGLGPSPRDEPLVNYLVDAHFGTILYYYSAQPTLDGAQPPMPAKCRGLDEEGVSCEFWGEVEGSTFVMSDPRRRTKTYDLRFEDLKHVPLPQAPIGQASNDWQGTHKAAVSAHTNAMRVWDFYNDVLQRRGVDDGGMVLVSVVNATYGRVGNDPVWKNAVWHRKTMWYGQTPGAAGTLVSMSRYLDVIAHELTHGVIEHSSRLVYRDEAGALDESFCDIFGVIVKNWYEAPDRHDVATWSWEIAPGFRTGGKPLRDLQDPTRTGHPDHYANRYSGTADYGGVHTNSNIHNRAAYNVLTATDDNGARTFSVEDAAVLFYSCMVRLSPQARFTEALRVLTDVTKTYFAGDPDVRDRNLAAIRAAYGAVGI